MGVFVIYLTETKLWNFAGLWLNHVQGEFHCLSHLVNVGKELFQWNQVKSDLNFNNLILAKKEQVDFSHFVLVKRTFHAVEHRKPFTIITCYNLYQEELNIIIMNKNHFI